MIAAVFVLAGLAAGWAQATLLARAARGRAGPFGALGRVLLVGLVLLLAARAGCLAFGVGGWIAGFGVGSLLVCRRLA